MARICWVFVLSVLGLGAVQAQQHEPEHPAALQWVMAYSHAIGQPEVIGPTAEGLRFNTLVAAGTFHGDKIKGQILPGGSARVIVRADGVCSFAAHATGKTEDGALLLIEADGSCDLGKDGYTDFIEGRFAPKIKLWIVSKIRTGADKYEWLNRKQFVQFGHADLKGGTVAYDVYALE